MGLQPLSHARPCVAKRAKVCCASSSISRLTHVHVCVCACVRYQNRDESQAGEYLPTLYCWRISCHNISPIQIEFGLIVSVEQKLHRPSYRVTVTNCIPIFYTMVIHVMATEGGADVFFSTCTTTIVRITAQSTWLTQYISTVQWLPNGIILGAMKHSGSSYARNRQS